jgi:hypothetical protein
MASNVRLIGSGLPRAERHRVFRKVGERLFGARR